MGLFHWGPYGPQSRLLFSSSNRPKTMQKPRKYGPCIYHPCQKCQVLRGDRLLVVGYFEISLMTVAPRYVVP